MKTRVSAKFHAPEYPGLPRCEFATINWARAAGLRVPPFDLRTVGDFDVIPEGLPTGDGSVFLSERFDRQGDERIHMEDFGQILDRPPGDPQYHGRYEELSAVLRWIAPESAAEFLKLIVFNVLCGNGDAHLKNFSVVYHDGRNATLSPAYDLVSTIQYCPRGRETLALSLSGRKSFQSVALGSFDRLTSLFGFATASGRKVISDAVRATLDAWHRPEVQELFSGEQVVRIDDHLKEVPLATDVAPGS